MDDLHFIFKINEILSIKVHPLKIHKWYIMEIICSAILLSSLRYFPIPTCQIVKSRFLFGYIATLNVPLCQVHFAKQQWPAVKSMLLSQHSKAANSTSPRWDCQIAESKFTLWTALQLPKEIKVSGLNNAWIFSIPLKLLALKN
jgi:hypothetical protein